MTDAIAERAVVACGWDGGVQVRDAVVEEMIADGESVDRNLERSGDLGVDVGGGVVWR